MSEEQSKKYKSGHHPNLVRERIKHQWKPGQSGNPKGRPKKKVISEYIRDILQEEVEGQITGRMIAKKIIEFAMEGKFPFAKEILDRTEGKVPDRTKLSGDEGPPIQAVDLSAMSLEQLLEFYSRLKKAKEEEDQDHYDGSDPTE